jgi:hypothetical protein
VKVGGEGCSSPKCDRAPGRGLSTSSILRCVVCSPDLTVSSFHEVHLMSPRKFAMSMFATAVLVVSACGGSGETDAGPGASANSAVSTELPADLEPVFVPTATGDQLDFNSLRGQDVLLWFWAPW